MFSKFKQLAGQSSVYTFGEMLRTGLGFILLPVYTRALTPADYGILGVTAPIFALLSTVIGLGLPAAMLRFYFDYRNDEDKLRVYMGTVSSFLILSGLVTSLIMTAIGPWLFGKLLPDTPFHPYLFLAVWNAGISIISLIPLTLFRARQKAQRYIIFTVVDFVLNTALIIYFVTVLNEGALGSLRGQVISALVMAVPALWIIIRASSPHFSRPMLRSSLAFSLPLLPHLLANWALNVSDRIILNGQVSNSQLGLYTLGYQFGILLNMVAVALNNAWVPFFYQNTEDPEHRDTIPPFITYQVLLMALLSLAVALLSREVIQIMANRSFWSSYQVVPWVVLGYMARFLYFFPVNGLLYTKRTKWTMIATLIAAAVNISLNLWLVPQYGIMAAAVNTFVGFLVLLVIIFVVGQRIYPVKYETRRLVQIGVISLALFAIGWWLLPGGLWIRMAAKSLLVLSFPVILWFTGFFTTAERRRFRQVVSGLAKRRV